MKISQRQKRIIDILQKAENPINGDTLAKEFSVSRQIIVKDISLLKAFGLDIISTNKGYKIENKTEYKKIIETKHEDKDIKDELNTIVDNGGIVIDVFINHPVYGVIKKNLDIHSRNGVNNFVKNMTKTKPLKELTEDVHFHTISAKSLDDLEKIEEALREKGYLN